MPNIPAFPQPLLDAYRDRRVAVLFGSGLSLAPDVVGGFPRWDQLPGRFLDELEKHGFWAKARVDARRSAFAAPMSLEDMLAELDVIKTALKHKYQAALNGIFRPANAAPGAVHHAIVALDVNVLATTNYDQLLEHAEGPPRREAYTWREADKALSDIEDRRKVLFKLHGSAENEKSVVMTRREYDEAAKDPGYQRIMSHLLKDQTFLLVGYGINDPLDLDLVFGFTAGAFGAAARTHYALVRKDVASAHGDRWQREMNIQAIPYDDHADLPAILRELAKTPRNPP